MSPRKVRLVAEHIRGRPVPEARTILAFTDRAAAKAVEKVLRSAVANAEANHGLHGDDLIVEAAYVDEGPVMKRWRARARGRVARIRKPTCHITVRLAPAKPSALEEQKPKRMQRAKVEAAPAEEVLPAEEAEDAPSEAKAESAGNEEKEE